MQRTDNQTLRNHSTRFMRGERDATATIDSRGSRSAPKTGVLDHSSSTTPRAAYIHVPFCRHRCGYCSFTLLAGRDDLIAEYLAALDRELSWLEQPRPVETLFFGGGTPTHLPPADLQRLLELARHWFPLVDGGEFSVEANPVDLASGEIAQSLAGAGANRLSLGVQSFDSRKLALLERDHGAREIERSFQAARQAARSVSLDLIFGVPGESLDDWRRDLDHTLRLAPDHISTYGLTFEKGTNFWSRLLHAELDRVDEELEREMYELAIDTLTAAGFEHYEVSNFARPSHRCRHNENYWLGGQYFAAGPGAARYIAGRREVNHRSTTTYIRRVLADQSPVAESEELGPQDAARERLVFALRRLEGIDLADFQAATGYSAIELGGDALQRFLERRLLEQSGGRLRLTRHGLLISDSLWPAFLRA